MKTLDLTKESFDVLVDYFKNEGLSNHEITYGMNGYPKGPFDRAIIGFTSFEQAAEMAEITGLQITLFEKRYGHSFYQNKGRMNRALTSDDYLQDLGDNYSQADSNNEYYKEQLVEIASNFDGDFDDLKAAIKQIEEIITEVNNCDDNQVVIVRNGSYYETVNREMMMYHEDVTNYAVGLLLPINHNENIDENEEEAE